MITSDAPNLLPDVEAQLQIDMRRSTYVIRELIARDTIPNSHDASAPLLYLSSSLPIKFLSYTLLHNFAFPIKTPDNTHSTRMNLC